MELVPRDSTELAGPEQSLETLRKIATEELISSGIKLSGLGTRGAKAVVAQRMLELVDHLDTGVYTLRALLLKEIEDEKLFASHPEDYESTQDMVWHTNGRNMATSELSDYLKWAEIVRPALQRLGYNDGHFGRMGKAKMRKLVPITRALTGDKEAVESIQMSIEYVQDELREGNVLTDDMPEDEINELTLRTIADYAYTCTWTHFNEKLGSFKDKVSLTAEEMEGYYKISGVVSPGGLGIIQSRMGRQLELELKEKKKK